MALLDVSDLLSDPDFADTITLVRLTVEVGDDGFARTTEQKFLITGSVQAGTGDNQSITPDAAQVSGGIVVYTTTLLCPALDEAPADNLIWQDRRYIVRQVQDWSNYGAGYYQAIADLVPVTA